MNALSAQTRCFDRSAFAALSLATLLSVGLPFGLHAQSGVIEGHVLANDGNPVAGASVQLRGISRTTLTSQSGHFTFAWLEPGVYWLEITALGYAPRADSILLGSNATIEIEARLSADPVALPALVVTARSGSTAAWLASRGVPQRGATEEAILHATRRDLTFQGIRDLRALLRRAPGVRLRELVDSGSELLLEPSPLPNGSPCVVEIYLNGVPMNLGRLSEVNFRGEVSGHPRPLRLDDLAAVEEIDALELYGPDDSPVASASGCGALLIWSGAKRGDWDNEFRGTIRGTVTEEATGNPLGNARIKLEPGAASTRSDDTGGFEIDNLLPGEYVLSVHHAGAEPWEAVVRIQAFGIVTVELRITDRVATNRSNQLRESRKARINFR